MRYHFRIHHEKSGYWGECLELAGCHSQGDSLEELTLNLKTALDLYLSEPANSPLEFPLPQKNTKSVRGTIAVQVDPRIAFSMLLKRIRLQRDLTQKQAARLMGLTGSLWLYQRLEMPKGRNPELDTLARVKRAFPEFSLDLILG